MINIIKRLFGSPKQEPFIGAEFDPRSDDEKKRDYSAEEIPLATAVGQPFTNKKPEKLEKDEVPQYRVGMCGPSATLTQCEYMGLGEKASRLDLYIRRRNKGTPGTWMQNNYDNLRSDGYGLYEDMPNDPKMTEADSNRLDPTALDGKRRKFDSLTTFRFDKPADFQRIGALVNAGFAVQVGFYADFTEWGNLYVTAKTKNLEPTTAPVRHFITFVPSRDFTENGKQYLTAHDSSPQNGFAMWYADEKFVNERCFDAGVVTVLSQEKKKGRKATVPIAACEYGQESESVKKLQNWLIGQTRPDGSMYLPAKYNTKYYGGLTSHAVLKWQLDNIAEFKKLKVPEEQIVSLAGHYWGPASIKVALKLDAKK